MRLSNPLAVLFSSLALSHSWVLDASCKQYAQTVEDAMAGAFDFAQAGHMSLVSQS